MPRKKRKILLIEPGYRNKYPPIGLMKIATYHRMLGDKVVFFKGDLKEFALEEITIECIKKLTKIDENYDWLSKKTHLKEYIKTNKSEQYQKVLSGVKNIFEDPNSQMPLIELWLKHYTNYFKKKEYRKTPKWDRIYVTTLFTFYWKITVKTIEEAKFFVKSQKELKVGGVLASLLKKELEEETGIKPLTGLLDKPGVLDADNDIIIDDLPLDYSILYEIDYEYPTGSAYFTFMTKGCTRTCSFCSVPKLEPTYKEKIPTIDKFNVIKEKYGEQQHLLLMDNNVLASPKFPEIIQEIKDMGFYKGATFVEPNHFDIAIKNLREGTNDKAYIRRCFSLLSKFLDKRVKKEKAQEFYDLLDKYGLLSLDSITKKNLLKANKIIAPIYERYRDKIPKQRVVDFNQGTDARYVTDELMRLMSEIPIYPLRIAFDYWGMKKQYENAVRLAAKYGISHLSNYLLYNFKDKPEDLYNRMKLNIDLSEELAVHIYSFPMKYIPLFGEEAKHRKFVGNKWNPKFIRAIQSISNVTRGIVPPGRSFFEKAFGKSFEDFIELLYMPETYLIYRKIFEEELGYTLKWREQLQNLTELEKIEAFSIIEKNDFKNINEKTKNPNIINLLKHYTITRGDIQKVDSDYLQLKQRFDKLINNDQFVDLTLTYDFE